MITRAPLSTMLAVTLLAGPGQALQMAECIRTTHVSHGGEQAHADRGDGWVTWESWWSQEGVSTDLHIADCRAHRILTTRLREARIRPGVEYDRRDAGAERVDRHMRRAPALRSLSDLSEALDAVGQGTRIQPMAAETCACAAAYPDARGDLTPFALN